MSARQKTYQLISTALHELGWTAPEVPYAPSLAHIEFETAVGPKTAHATDFWPSCQESVTLSGVYFSEGRNVLSNVFETISVNASLEEVKKVVVRYMHNVTQAVDTSYARKLYLQQ